MLFDIEIPLLGTDLKVLTLDVRKDLVAQMSNTRGLVSRGGIVIMTLKISQVLSVILCKDLF